MSRWLVITQDFPPDFIGGISAWAHDLARALDAEGEPVTVLARRTTTAHAWDSAQGLTIHRMWGRSWSRWQALWTTLAVRPYLTSDTVVIAATWGLATRLVGPVRRAGARLAVAAHGSELTQLTEAPPSLRALSGAVDAWLPVSGFLAGELDRLNLVEPHDPRVHVLPMPIPPPTTEPAPRGDALICVARPTPLKGIDRVVALARALDRPLHLIGPDATDHAHVDALGVLTRPETQRRMAQAAACVLLPRTDDHGFGAEGLGLALLEAANHGVPVIGCATGGVPEAVGPGLLLDNPDDPDVDTVASWLAEPTRGDQARTWLRAHHGPHHTLRVLREAVQ